MKAKVSPNLISFITVRRGNWILKISVFKKSDVLVIAQHYYNENVMIRHFTNHDDAVLFLDYLANEDNV